MVQVRNLKMIPVCITSVKVSMYTMLSMRSCTPTRGKHLCGSGGSIAKTREEFLEMTWGELIVTLKKHVTLDRSSWSLKSV